MYLGICHWHLCHEKYTVSSFSSFQLSAASKGKCDKQFAFTSWLVLLTSAPYFDRERSAILPISKIISEILLIFSLAMLEEVAMKHDLNTCRRFPWSCLHIVLELTTSIWIFQIQVLWPLLKLWLKPNHQLHLGNPVENMPQLTFLLGIMGYPYMLLLNKMGNLQPVHKSHTTDINGVRPCNKPTI